jgi:hypothetical protein
MANSSLTLTSLDFDTLKQNFKTYLSSQSVFKDYNFDGSNINVLLDVMSYNTYLNSFYLNMVASEMFLDSAQKYESVVSHAKELNYIPKSARSAASEISFTFDTKSISSPLYLKKGSKFSGTNSNGTFTFTTDLQQSFVSSSNTYSINNLRIYEGIYFTDSFLIDYNIENQRYLLSNKNIDTSSITVSVIENNGLSNTVFAAASTLFGLDSLSEVYFLQGAENNKYEIIFGDGLFGRKPLNTSIVSVEYRVTNGTDALGVDNFVLLQDIGGDNNGSIITPFINVNTVSAGGANQESIESIKFAAPRYFATQQRAVATEDYSSLIKSNFGGVISDVNVYGGETLETKLYGRVIVCLKPTGALVAPNYVKDQISNYLLNYIGLPTRIMITDPDYLYINVDSSVQYNTTATTKLNTDIQTAVRTAIKEFSTLHLEQFNNDFRYSKFVYAVDNADSSITSNSTEVKISKRITPKYNYATSYVLNFNNSAEIEKPAPGYDPAAQPRFYDEPMLESSGFTYVTDSGQSYNYCYMRDDNFGVIVVYTFINNVFTIIKDKIGTIDYVNGIVKINNLTTSYYENHISIYVHPMNKDIIVSKDKIIVIDLADVTVNVIPTIK